MVFKVGIRMVLFGDKIFEVLFINLMFVIIKVDVGWLWLKWVIFNELEIYLLFNLVNFCILGL